MPRALWRSQGGARFLLDEVPLYVYTPEALLHREYRDTSLIRNTPLLGPYSRTLPRVLGGS